ncbi:MAG: class I SAM-dependent methyltransferase [Bacteroidia bacterium]|nr:class I SAM-dependent methyltransferase [Bacteroidia bacterium]
MVNYHQLKAFIKHWLTSVDKHSIHSPFFFDFYNKVILDKTDPGQFSETEQLRSNLLVNSTEIEIIDFGAGSKKLNGTKRKLLDIASTSLTPQKFARLYYNIITYQKAKNIVELGTSLGITSLYLAKSKACHVTTFEGSRSLADVAITNFEYFEKQNIELIEGNINSTLQEFVQNPAKINFVLIDANHQYAPTLRYFNMMMRRLNEKSIVVLDDIHWSEEMERAWNELRTSQLVYGSIDLFRCGILFFDPDINRQHFVLNL